MRVRFPRAVWHFTQPTPLITLPAVTVQVANFIDRVNVRSEISVGRVQHGEGSYKMIILWHRERIQWTNNSKGCVAACSTNITVFLILNLIVLFLYFSFTYMYLD